MREVNKKVARKDLDMLTVRKKIIISYTLLCPSYYFKSFCLQTYVKKSKREHWSRKELMNFYISLWNLLVLAAGFNPLKTNFSYHIETSQLICNPNQLTSFSMMPNIGR